MIYVFLAEGFEEVEAITPIDLLRRAGFKVVTVGVTGKVVTGARGIPVTADITAENLSTEGLEMMILPGGMPGTKNLAASPEVNKMIDYCVKNDIYTAAICAAPTILGNLGLLKGRKATCYPGMEEQLLGAEKVTDRVAVDGKFITSRGAGTAVDLSYALIDALGGNSSAIANSIVWTH